MNPDCPDCGHPRNMHSHTYAGESSCDICGRSCPNERPQQ